MQELNLLSKGVNFINIYTIYTFFFFFKIYKNGYDDGMLKCGIIFS